MPDATYTKDGIDKTAEKLRESSIRNGTPITHEQARDRVIQAVRNEENSR